MFVAEGVRTVEELLQSRIEMRGALVSPALEAAARGRVVREALVEQGVEIVEVDEAEFASAADTESPQGILVVAQVPHRELDALSGLGHRYLVLDAVQDPGNVGTMIRTAAAFGVAATIAMPGTVDVWNAKVVRSAMGAMFVHPVLPTTWDAFDVFRAEHGLVMWGADAGGEPISALRGLPERLAIVVGNEGNGMGAEARGRVERVVSIPAPHVESLNVAVAAGILLYALTV
jgi:RNA methyltransferase, TrmH family